MEDATAKEHIEALYRGIAGMPDIEPAEIPKLDLYMDQVITLFESVLEPTKRHPGDKLLTKTMINNYTKDKLLLPAKNKKYSPEHIIQMALIYHLKQTLSIGDIKTLFQGTLHREDVDGWKVYEQFLRLKEEQAPQLESAVSAQTEAVASAGENQALTLLAVLTFIHQANTYKRLAEKLIDDLEKRMAKDKDKDKDKEKSKKSS
ncbi:DUF1836 domain-containing protein [Paenibacillus thiaminolyticus]|uniref:DUF1836 domain-containing protein n=1 Tax=Paenibacillus thiaminolyticus TaxID=49283 RepID=UPI00232E2E10|nr:DUF1836 domain-containing protein [Paenibacillus thiaminolyticus]WCF08170.1 DUF1836 domain-containing protein [Paenibacillus thiaminolyticus]